jgi:ribosomal RNA-processing protein 12
LYTAVPAGSEEAGQRLAAFETIKLYYQLSDAELLNTLFDKGLEKYRTETAQFTKDAIMDLLRSLIPHIGPDRLAVLYQETMARVTSTEQKEQKKAYRLLEELCRGPSEAAREFLVSALPALRTALLSSLSAAAPSAQVFHIPVFGIPEFCICQAPRLRCLMSILGQLEAPQPEFALALVPEAVLSIRAVNSKARAAAFTLLIGVGEALQRWSQGGDTDQVLELLAYRSWNLYFISWILAPPSPPSQVIGQYMTCMMAGLAGNPGLIHCTVLAVSRVYFQFRDIFPDYLTEQVVFTNRIFTNRVLQIRAGPPQHPAAARQLQQGGGRRRTQLRQGKNPVLSFCIWYLVFALQKSQLQVFITATPLLQCSRHVPGVVSALVKMPEDCKRHFRVKTKFLLERLVR